MKNYMRLLLGRWRWRPCRSAASAQNITFYDTMSGANFVQWWQTYAVPALQGRDQGGYSLCFDRLARSPATHQGGGRRATATSTCCSSRPTRSPAFTAKACSKISRRYASLIPNLTKTEAPDKDKAAGVDLKGTGAPFFRYTYALIYNSDQVKNPPRTWKELYERRNEWKGKISYVDPRSTVSGAGRFFTAMFLRSFGANLDQVDASWDPAWQKLKEFEDANAKKHAESGGAHVAQFATGEIVIGFHALDFALYSRKLGTVPPSIKTVLMEDGVPAGAGYLAIPKNIPAERKQAAARFINCALSDTVQSAMVKEMFEFPGTAVWDKLPAEVYQSMPTREIFFKSRAPDPSAAALKQITDVWAGKVGY